MAMRARNLPVLGPQGFISLAYWEWEGPSGAPTVLCVHGLTRNGRDFDFLAEALANRFRVICPDMPGRGRSDWLDDPQLYGFPFYLSVLGALYARLDTPTVHWVGTSMGGLLGMLFASLPNSPVRSLVLNDVGPIVAKEGLERIGRTVGSDPSFLNRKELDAYLRENYQGFGPLSAAHWRHLLAHSGRTRGDGKLGLAYDPKIGDAFRATEGEKLQDVDFWNFYDQIRCPTLVLRGVESDILRAADAAAMQQRGPRAELAEYPGVGHAPALMAHDQIGAVRKFLLDG
ncbi:MAG: alpha/beta hydrolase [Alphaproteobacteria bacterium]|nr:alpha/beta hydrolase [Alphaproteobacteria bacterium]